MPVLQPRKEQVGTVCQPEKVLGQRRAVNDGMTVAVVGTAAVAVVAAAAARREKNATALTTTMLPAATAVQVG